MLNYAQLLESGALPRSEFWELEERPPRQVFPPFPPLHRTFSVALCETHAHHGLKLWPRPLKDQQSYLCFLLCQMGNPCRYHTYQQVYPLVTSREFTQTGPPC